jgi:GEVED domain/Secretion system C-terminal sorting domain
MKKLLLSAGLLMSGFSYSQYCTTGGPTSTADSNVQLVRILGQGDSIRFVGCPGVLGVQNLTNLSVTLNAGNSYQLSVQFGTCGGDYFGGGEAWIDYDNNGSFDPTESLGTWSGTPPVALSNFSFSVPLNVLNGPSRMRVIQQEGGNALPPLNPCASFQWGSVMDFTVNFTGGVNCSAYTGDDTDDPIIVTAFPYTHNGDNSYCYFNQNLVYASPDVYYLVTPAANAVAIHASLCGSNFDTFLSVIDKNGNVIAYNDDAAGCAPYSQLTFATAGIDTAYVIVEGWGTNSGTYTLNLNQDFVGINEYNPAAFSLYPNPANESFLIKGILNSAVTITDVIGNTVERIVNYQGEAISVAEYSNGIYFVQFVYEGRSYSQKITVSK